MWKIPPLAVAVPLCLVASARAQVPKVQNQGSGPGYEMLEGLLARAKAALDAGDADLAAKVASEVLAGNTDKSSWNYGNVVYEGNQILGLSALRKGDVAAAKRCLLAAGRTPGSPQLDSFGPEMTLAQELLAKGETETVLQFLDLVAKFWATSKPGASANSVALDRQHATTLEGWKKEIRAGGKPGLDRFRFPIPSWVYAFGALTGAIFVMAFLHRNRLGR